MCAISWPFCHRLQSSPLGLTAFLLNEASSPQEWSSLAEFGGTCMPAPIWNCWSSQSVDIDISDVGTGNSYLAQSWRILVDCHFEPGLLECDRSCQSANPGTDNGNIEAFWSRISVGDISAAEIRLAKTFQKIVGSGWVTGKLVVCVNTCQFCNRTSSVPGLYLPW